MVDVSAIVLQPGIRPKQGSRPGPDGKYADADQEVFVAACVGCIKAGPQLLGRDGKQRGVMIPIAIFSRPYEEIADVARKQLNVQTQADEQKTLVES